MPITKSPNNEPDVVAYRVGELEKAVREGFIKHNAKLDDIINNFPTRGAFIELEKRVIAMEQDKKWRNRAIMTAVLGAGFLSIFTFLFTLLGH